MVFQFKIQLTGTDGPLVWRRVMVPAQFSFFKFHMVIQRAFGWEGYHLFQFSPGGYNSYPIISIPDPEVEDEGMDAKKIKLGQIFTHDKQVFTYIYDFGDDWKHKIKLEKIITDKMLKADCTAGEGACPPEDCGGPWGYMNLVEILKDPAHPEHDDMKEWLGLDDDEGWDENNFDLEEAQKKVRLI